MSKATSSLLGDANLRKYKDHINFALLSKRIDVCLNEEIIESFIDEQWDWSVLSANRNVEISINFVFAHKDKKWDWKALSRNLSVKWSSKQSQKIYPEIFKNESINKTIDWNVFLTRRDLLIDKQLLFHEFDLKKIRKLHRDKTVIDLGDSICIKSEDFIGLKIYTSWKDIEVKKPNIKDELEDAIKSIKKGEYFQIYLAYPKNSEFTKQIPIFVDELKNKEYQIKAIPYSFRSIIKK